MIIKGLKWAWRFLCWQNLLPIVGSFILGCLVYLDQSTWNSLMLSFYLTPSTFECHPDHCMSFVNIATWIWLYIIRWKFIVIHDVVNFFCADIWWCWWFLAFSYHFLIGICVRPAFMKILSKPCVVLFQVINFFGSNHCLIDIHYIERH